MNGHGFRQDEAPQEELDDWIHKGCEDLKEKRFREDLFYRLHIVPIHLPPLRERPEDVLALSKYFLSEYARKFSCGFRAMSEEAQKLLLAYSWPGNVRELRNVMERICIMHKGETLQPEHLPKELTQELGAATLRAESFDYPIPREGIDLEAVVDEFATHLIRRVLQMADGNISQAAKLLKIPRVTLRYKIEKMQGDG